MGAVAEQNADGLGQAPSADDADLIGRAVGAYRLVKLLGRGGMGAVYLGEHPSIGSKVAIKLLRPQHATDRQLIERFFNEARAVNLIGHDNIVKVLDYDVTDDGRYYCVMELLAGRPLAALLRPGRALPLRVAGPIFLQCCRALQAAHEHGIVHRDLKPDNVYLVRQGDRDHFVKLLDFGIAKLASAEGGRTTNPGVVIGTPAYMSPEQAAGDVHLVGPLSDVYSLGVMMFEIATGRTPFEARDGSLASVLMAHLHESPPQPRSIEPTVPEAYERLVLRCLAKAPSARWASMADLEAALAGCLRGLAVTADLPRVKDVEGLDPEPSAAQEASRRTPASPPATRDPAPGRTLKDGRSTEAPRRRWLIPVAAGVAAAGGLAFFLVRYSRSVEARPEPVPPPAPAAVRPPPPTQSAPAEPSRQPPTETIPPRPVRKQQRRVALKAPKPSVESAAPVPAPAPPVERVRLMLVSVPRALVDATWPGGSARAQTPGTVEVPKNARVKLVFTAPGYVEQIEEIEAAVPRAVTATLQAE